MVIFMLERNILIYEYHFIHYIIEAGTIKLVYCPMDDMTADALTKALPSVKAKHFASALGLSTGTVCSVGHGLPAGISY